MTICIDYGGSLIKVAVKDKEDFILNRYNSECPYNFINSNADNNTNIIITGTRASKIDRSRMNGNIFVYDEIECIANLIPFLNLEEGIVVNIGTGTPFVFYNKGEVQHISGTGLGGGTLGGLSRMLLNTEDYTLIEKLASKGNLPGINLTMADVSQDELSWLKDNFTCSNFAKKSNSKEDISAGIHSLISEPIGIISVLCSKLVNTGNIVFSGMLSENKVIKKRLEDTLEIYGLKAIFFDNSSYGTCFGAFHLFEKRKGEQN